MFKAPVVMFALLIFSGVAHALPPLQKLVEVPIYQVYFPPVGYDSNDNVQVLIEGELPDPCYVLGNHTVQEDPLTHQMVIHQFAWRNDSPLCGTGDLLGEVPFSVDVSLGILEMGDYKLGYSHDNKEFLSTTLRVNQAVSGSVDDLRYAPVTQISVPDVVISGESIQVVLSGRLPSPCSRVKSPVSTESVGNVFVLRPVVIETDDCSNELRTYQETVNLGLAPTGNYLIHVRSASGRALQRTIFVY